MGKNALDLAITQPPVDPTFDEAEHALIAARAGINLLGCPMTNEEARVTRLELRRHLKVVTTFLERERIRRGLKQRLDVRA